MKVRTKHLEGQLVLIFLYISPIVDNFLGIAMEASGGDSFIGKAFRMGFLAVLLCVLVFNKVERKTFCALAGLLVCILLFPLIYSVLDASTAGLLTDYSQLAKLIYPVVLVWTIESCLRRGTLGEKQIQNCLAYYTWFYPVSVLIPYFMGIGHQSYEVYDAGYRGFYSAGNELSIVLVSMYIYALHQAVIDKKVSCFVCAMLNAFSVLLTGTKTGIIMLVAGTFYIMFRGKSLKQIFLRSFFVLTCAALIGVFVSSVFSSVIENNVAAILDKYSRMNTDFVSFMLSNRNRKIIPNFNSSILGAKTPLLNFLFGRGYYRQVTLSEDLQYSAEAGLVEMDLFDIFYQHGVILSIGVVVFYLSRVIFKCSNVKKIYRFVAVVILLFGILAGHTLQSTLPSTLLALSIILLNAREVPYGKSR